jgi:hypothetical protein
MVTQVTRYRQKSLAPEEPADDLTKETDTEMFARSLYGWVGAHGEGYANARAADLEKVGDNCGYEAWRTVAATIRKLHDQKIAASEVKPRAAYIEPINLAAHRSHRQPH